MVKERWGWDDITGDVYANPGRSMPDHWKTHMDGVVEFRRADQRYLTFAGTREAALVAMAAHIEPGKRNPEMPQDVPFVNTT